MRNFKIIYNPTEFGNELASVRIDGMLYRSDDLSFEAKELLTVMTYEDYQLSIEYFDNIAQMIGYDNTLKGIQDLTALGANISTDSINRKLIMNSYKDKYKGLWR